MIKIYYLNRSNYILWPIFFKPFTIFLFLNLVLGCSNESLSQTTANVNSYELFLNERSGTTPQVPNMVPHQQLDQNSPPEILERLKSFLFSMDHVEEKRSGTSLPSALGAYIKSSIKVNSKINLEFNHIHMEPGPGSQHLVIREKDFFKVIENGWGIKHPWSDRLIEDGYILMMVYAPRNDNDLENVKRIISAAWHLALSDD